MFKLFSSNDFGVTYTLDSESLNACDLIEKTVGLDRRHMRWYIEKDGFTEEVCSIISDIIIQTLASPGAPQLGFTTDDKIVRKLLEQHGIPVYSSEELVEKLSYGWGQHAGAEAINTEMEGRGYSLSKEYLH